MDDVDFHPYFLRVYFVGIVLQYGETVVPLHEAVLQLIGYGLMSAFLGVATFWILMILCAGVVYKGMQIRDFLLRVLPKDEWPSIEATPTSTSPQAPAPNANAASAS